MCTIEGCDAKPVAKGLCAKHYMRVRRQGDADKIGKPGCPKSYYHLEAEKIFPWASPRTRARFVRARVLLSDAEFLEQLKLFTRKSGNINVNGLLKSVEDIVWP